jgi:Zn-finger nucleic acid-binding protein
VGAIGGVGVQQCAKCGGLWVAGDRFDALVQRALESRRARAAEGRFAGPAATRRLDPTVVYRACPACGSRMHRKNFGGRSGVLLDWCGPHGVWLDAGELEHVAAFVLGGGLADARGAGEAIGLSEGGPMPIEAFRARVEADRRIEELRERVEGGGGAAAGSLARLLLELLR